MTQTDLDIADRSTLTLLEDIEDLFTENELTDDEKIGIVALYTDELVRRERLHQFLFEEMEKISNWVLYGEVIADQGFLDTAIETDQYEDGRYSPRTDTESHSLQSIVECARDTMKAHHEGRKGVAPACRPW